MFKNSNHKSFGGRSRPALVTALILILTCALLPLTAAAVTINLTQSPGSAPPASDAAGAQLTAIMTAAADYWEDIIRDPYVVEITYGYSNVGDPKAAFACYTDMAGVCIDGVVLPSMPNTAAIAVDTTVDSTGVPVQWYFDPTPNDHSEFDLQQTLARDLTPGQITNIFTGTVPDLLEVSYFGPALPAFPTAQSGIDLFTVVLHEMGHVLGMLNEFSLPEAQDNGAFDFDSLFVDGAAAGAKTAAGITDHLAAGGALMRPAVGNGVRYLPTATDVFAIAAAPGWNDIHLPRRELWGGMAYHLTQHWSGNSIPDGTDDVWVRWGGATGLNADTDAQSLVVSDDSMLYTMGKTLQVGGYTTVEQGGGTGATLEVNSDLLSGGVRIRDGGIVSIDGGQIQAWLIEIEAGGTLASGGADTVTAAAFDNDGTLAASGFGQLVVNTFPDMIDLDGPSDSGQVEAVGGDLLLQDGLSDPFDGVMTVGVGGTIDFVEPWTLASGGQLFLAGGLGGDQARIEGGDMVLQGTVEVTGQARIAATLSIESSAAVTVAADSELQLRWLTELAGGTYTGPGTIQLNGDTSVTWPTVMAPGIVDLDGGTGNTEINLTWGLTLKVDGIDLYNNVFDGTVNVQGWLASLRVFLSDPLEVWEMDGVLDLSAHDFWPTTQLDGNDVIIDGTMNVDGLPRLSANIDLRGTLSTADADARALLNSGGVNIFRDSATVAGAGRVVVQDGTELQLETGFNEPLRLDNEGTVAAGVETGNLIAMPQVLFYTQAATGALELEIGGLIAGVDHDRLWAIGNAELAGTLRVDLVNGFVPQLGDSFYLVTTSLGSVIGTFGTTHLPALDPSLQWSLVYGSDTVLLEVVAAPVIVR